MNNKKEFRLLSDLARLLAIYGPEAFEDLAHRISDPIFRDHLVAVLKTTAHVHRKLPKVNKKRSDAPKTDFQLTLMRSSAEKGALLADLYDALRMRSVLPTLKEMKNFAMDNGLPPVKSTSREKALVPFVKTFLKLPIEEVREYLRRIQMSPSSNDRSLQGWSDIIFGNEVGDRRI